MDLFKLPLVSIYGTWWHANKAFYLTTRGNDLVVIPCHGTFAEDIIAFSMVSGDRYIARLPQILKKMDDFRSDHA